MAITLIKYNGNKEDYNRDKALNSLKRSGVDEKKAFTVLQEIEKQLPQTISTKDLYRRIYQGINAQGYTSPAKIYRIREVLSKMDSIEFEKIISDLFTTQNITCSWNQIVVGQCIDHQIDVIAKNQLGKHLIEVKRHANPHKEIGLGTVIELWGRFIDISSFTSCVLVTNSKFSLHAKKFAKCRKVGLLGWRYNSTDLFSDHENGLETIIEVIGKDKVLNILQSHI